jgi:L-ascorbate metabolism protein UlaG (beta-lactamase superfamily)
MKIQFLGHAAFMITSDEGRVIITDPYVAGCYDGNIRYEPITEEAHIVTISHEHPDHSETNIKGNPTIVRDTSPQEVQGIKIHGVQLYHDESGGKERGTSIVFNMLVDDVHVVHLGDLGHALSPDDVKNIGDVDVLLIPVGGYFTIDAKAADDIINTLKPKIVIPMHYKTEKCGFSIASVEEFTKGKDCKKIGGELEIKRDTLPDTTTIYVMTPTK